MARCLITYDLHNRRSDADYYTIEDKLKELGAIEVQLSVWYYPGFLSAEELEQELRNALKKWRRTDNLIIAPVSLPDRWRGFGWKA